MNQSVAVESFAKLRSLYVISRNPIFALFAAVRLQMRATWPFFDVELLYHIRYPLGDEGLAATAIITSTSIDKMPDNKQHRQLVSLLLMAAAICKTQGKHKFEAKIMAIVKILAPTAHDKTTLAYPWWIVERGPSLLDDEQRDLQKRVLQYEVQRFDSRLKDVWEDAVEDMLMRAAELGGAVDRQLAKMIRDVWLEI